MATTHTNSVVDTVRQTDPARLAYTMLRTIFAVAPILFGLDKFFNVLTYWPGYLAGWIDNIVPGSAQTDMYIVGVIEIIAGLIVWFRPRIGAWIVCLWLLGIIVNLLTYSGYYDVALRDFGLLVSALALAMLARTYDRPLRAHAEPPSHE
ncbi:MAG: hypothetical protein L0H79_10635 [Intrasporangium sp.]|uniref:hypothetical protein n=1 Tax=Intrasporangium sp. TaxID=1925024 RepID=UPI0026470E17|nr:hypothetical protein [Intrasporangium sp.]MDN5796190.1 hypothetical protein [Intrasporangium sp.]